jgi:hypothetical protein
MSVMPSCRLYTIHTVMQIIRTCGLGFRAGKERYKLWMLDSDAVRFMEGR